MQVAVDATPLLGARTGVGTFCTALLAELGRAHPGEVQAFGLTWRGHADLPPVLPAGVAARGRRVPARLLAELWRHAPFPPLEVLGVRADVVHGTNFVAPPTARAAAVVTVHDLTPVRFPELCTPDTRRFPALITRAVDRGAHIHTPSRFVRDEVLAHFAVAPERVHAVPLGVRLGETGDAVAGRALAGHERFVLALGTVEPRKDLPLLVRAFDDVAAGDPGIGLVFAGPAGWDDGELDQAIASSRHRDRIRRLGWVGGTDRAGLLAGATVVAYPSRYEGFGLVPLEAMAAGTPVVTTAAGAVPEIVADAAVVVPVGDAAALAEVLSGLLADDERRADLAVRGRARAAGYSWSACAAGLWTVYEAAAADR